MANSQKKRVSDTHFCIKLTPQARLNPYKQNFFIGFADNIRRFYPPADGGDYSKDSRFTWFIASDDEKSDHFNARIITHMIMVADEARAGRSIEAAAIFEWVDEVLDKRQPSEYIEKLKLRIRQKVNSFASRLSVLGFNTGRYDIPTLTADGFLKVSIT